MTEKLTERLSKRLPSKSPDAFQLKFTKPKPVSSVWGKVGTARPLMLLPLLPIMNSFCNFVTKSNIFQMSDEYNISENFDAINDLVKMTQQLGKQAVVAYKPIVDDICSRDASEKEVAWLLDYMLDFLGNDQMLEFFKQVCRKYLEKYPDEIHFHIMEYYKLYEPEKLVGTEYEHLLDEMNFDD